MKVVRIEYDKKRSVFEIEVEDGKNFVLNYNSFEKYKISLDSELSETEILQIETQSDIERAKEKALNYIAGKLKTKNEVKSKLVQCGFNQDISDEVVFILENENFLNDRLYAQLFIDDKIKINGYGKNKIKSLLIQRGVSSFVFQDLLDNLDFDDEFENALKLGIKKLKLLKNEDNLFKKKQKLINYLAYRGFGFEIINRVLEEIL
ncbi:MAG: regulatory protein RecX [Peptoniphilaceae bacterium]|uniref:regulatory protein RecX n=1 Tax=Parvimonas sp. TaxID=1944660 RepID=UPI0025DEDE25|nr:regulatory protein RecX [Parvimonas sp.]MCI5997837.1 recombination regulator RecX [Parvimonas sp.]MDD7764546.1 regulatory protein RecX [Peptoniphilaceae bacterium]MDY3050524.1 regulatory protein RecX [Parvimonas sp.]